MSTRPSSSQKPISTSEEPDTDSVGEHLTGMALVGSSLLMRAVRRGVALVAPARAHVLIMGEPGTDAPIVARAIHANSYRYDAPFIDVRVAAMEPDTVAATLFGDANASGHGSEDRRQGLLVAAKNGTVFLDDLARVPLPAQAKLVRAIEQGEVIPEGGWKAQTLKVRIIVALGTGDEGRIRPDLFSALNVYPIRLPPLRDRLEDLPLLVAAFFRDRGIDRPERILSDETFAALAKHHWPGNVAEFRAALERLI